MIDPMDPNAFFDTMMLAGHLEDPWTFQENNQGEVLDLSLANALGLTMDDLLALISAGLLPARKSRVNDRYFIRKQSLEHTGLCHAGIRQEMIALAHEKIAKRNTTRRWSENRFAPKVTK